METSGVANSSIYFRKEIKSLVNVYFVNVVNVTLGMFVSKTTFLVLIVFYMWMGYSTNAELIFYVLNLFNQLNFQFGHSLPINFSKTAQLYASLFRLNKVLQAEELHKTDDESTEKPLVLMKDASFGLGNKDILKGVSINITKPGLTVVTGPVGSGKTSLLKIILQDYNPVTDGKYYL